MGPTIIGDVEVGHGNVFEPGVVIYGPTTIGDDNFFGAYTVIGGACRERYRLGSAGHRRGEVRIGSGNYFGEHSIMHAPVGRATVLGDMCSVGAGAGLAHDSRIGSNVTISLNCTVGGHSVLLDWSGLGIGCTVHPRTVMGQWSYAGMAAVVTRTVGIGELVAGNPARLLRLNYAGFARSGLASGTMAELRRFFETGQASHSEFIARVVADFESAVRRTVRKKVSRSWSDLTSEMSHG